MVANTGRQTEFDVAKTFAIFFMVLIHVAENACALSPDDGFLYFVIEFLGGPLAAPMFMFAMGVGVIFTRHNSPKEFAIRGVKLILMGYALNFFRETILLIVERVLSIDVTYNRPLLDSFANIDILQFAGMSFLLVALMKRFDFNTYMMLLVALILQGIGTLVAGYFSFMPRALQYLFGLLFQTNEFISFPTAQWFVYPAAGMCFAKLLTATTDKMKFYITTGAASIACFFAVTASSIFIGYDLKNYFTTSYFKQNLFSTLWILSITGISITLYYFISLMIKGKLLELIKNISSHVNTIYITQWLVITYSLAILYVFNGSILSPIFSFPAAIVVTTVSIIISLLIKRKR